MKSRKALLKKSQLYLILDRVEVGKRKIEDLAKALIHSEVDIVQLRDKVSCESEVINAAARLARVFKDSTKLFIVNDYIQAARVPFCDGLHLGQDDLSLQQARKVLGANKIIGISTHNLRQGKIAQDSGADYVGIGPIMATPTKPEYKAIGLEPLGSFAKKIKIPYFAIGGINQGNLKKIVACGASRVAVCRAILDAEDLLAIAKKINKKLGDGSIFPSPNLIKKHNRPLDFK